MIPRRGTDRWIRLLVEGRDRDLQFFQVLVLRAADVRSAKVQAQAYLRREGAELTSFDEEETAEIDIDTVPKEALRQSASVEGVISASGRIYALPPKH